jgi:small subunit ribosomal protein S8
MLNDPLSNVMSNMLNAEKIGKKTCILRPSSKVIKAVLTIMKNHDYIESYEDDAVEKTIKIKLNGSINKCGSIKPRYTVKKEEYEKYEKRYLPSKLMGFLVVSTSKGIMTHRDAKEKGYGGRLIAYFY